MKNLKTHHLKKSILVLIFYDYHDYFHYYFNFIKKNFVYWVIVSI